MENRLINKLLKLILPIMILVLIFIIPFKSQADDYDCKFEINYIESDNENVDFYVDITLKAINEIEINRLLIMLDAKFDSDDEIISNVPGIYYIKTLEEYCEINSNINVDLTYNSLGEAVLIYYTGTMSSTLTLESGDSIKIMKLAFVFEKMEDEDIQLPDFNGDFEFKLKATSRVALGSTSYKWESESKILNIENIKENSSSGGSTGTGGSGFEGEGDSSNSGIVSNGGQGSDFSSYDNSKITLNISLNSNSTNKKLMIDFEIEIPANYVFNQIGFNPLMYFNDSGSSEILENYTSSSYINNFYYSFNEDLGILIAENEFSHFLIYGIQNQNFDIKEDITIYLATLVLELKDDVDINKLRISFEIDDDTTYILKYGDILFSDVFNFTDLIITFGESSGNDGEDTPSKTSYTVTFNSNGGTTVENQTITSGNKVIQPSNPTKSGYTFKGWYESLNDTTPFNFDTIISSDLTLYAKWEENTSSGGSSGSGGSGSEGEGDSSNSGIVSNGGQGSDSSSYDNSKITLNISLNSNSTNKKLMIDFEIEIPANYVFNQIGFNPLMYFNDSGSSEILENYTSSSYINNFYYNFNEDLGILIAENEFSHFLIYGIQNQNFDIKEDKTIYLATLVLELKDDIDVNKLRISFEIDDDTTYILKYGDISFSDVFNFTDLIITFNDTTTTVYNVKYMLDSTTEYTSRQVVKGNKVIKPATPTKEGYTFAGWYESLDDLTPFDFDTTIINSNLTLYAKWESVSVPKYKVTLVALGITIEELTTSYIEQEPHLTKEGYTFLGWYETQTYTKQITFPYTPIRNITLYANFEENGILNKEDNLPSDTPYLIVEDSICSNDGYFTLKYYLYNPTNIILNSISVDVVNDGYCDIYSFESSTLIDFKLYDDNSGIYSYNIKISNTLIYIGTLTFKVKTTTEYNQKMSIDSSIMLTSKSTIDNSKLNSVLTEINSQFKFSVSFMVDNELYDKQYLLKLEEDKIPKPEKEGYTFIGWYTNKSCYEANKCSYPLDVTKDLTLYAKFESDSICSLEYNIIDSQSKILQIELYLINPKGLQINLIDLTFSTSVGPVIGYDYTNSNIFDNYEFEYCGILAHYNLKSSYTTDTRIYLGILLVLNDLNLTSGTISCDETYTLFDPQETKLDLKCEEYSFECSSTNEDDLSSDTGISKVSVNVDDTSYNSTVFYNNEYIFGKFDSSFEEATINVESTSTLSYIRIAKYNNLSALQSLSSDIKGSVSLNVPMYDSTQTYIIVVTAEDGTQKEYKVTLQKYTESQSTALISYELDNSDTINSYYQKDIIINVYLSNANYKVGKLDILLQYDCTLFEYSDLTISCEDFNLSSNILELTNYLTFTLYSDKGVLNNDKYLLCQIHLKLKEDIEHKAYYTTFDGKYDEDSTSIYNPQGTEKNSTTTGTSLTIIEGTSPYLTEFKLYDNEDNLLYEADLDDLIINNNTIEINVANGYTSLYYYLNAKNNTTVKLDSNIVTKENNNYISLSDDELTLIFNMSVYQEAQTAKITINIIKEEESKLDFIFELRNTDTIDVYYKNDIIIDIYIDNANYYISKIIFNLIYDTNIFEIKDDDYYTFESIYSLVSISNNNGTISVELESENGYFDLDKYLIGSISFKLKENLSQEDHDVEFNCDTLKFYNKSNNLQEYSFEALTFTVNSGNSPYLTQFYIEDSNGNVIYSATSQELNINNNTINVSLNYKYDSIKYFVDSASETTIYLNSSEVSKLTSYSLALTVEESITLEFSTMVSSNNTEAYITFIITREKEKISISPVLEVVDGCSFKYKTLQEVDYGFYVEYEIIETTHTEYVEGNRYVLSNVIPYLTIEKLLTQFKQYKEYLAGNCDFKVYNSVGDLVDEDEYDSIFTYVSTGYSIELYINETLTDKIYISIIGDSDQDGDVTTMDLTTIFDYYETSNPKLYNLEVYISMDVNGDGIVDLNDIDMIISHSSGDLDIFDGMEIIEYQPEEETSLLCLINELDLNQEEISIVSETLDNLIVNTYKEVSYYSHISLRNDCYDFIKYYDLCIIEEGKILI